MKTHIKEQRSTYRLVLDLIIVLIGASLIALLIWRYFEYKITSIKMEPHGLSSDSPVKHSQEIKQLF